MIPQVLRDFQVRIQCDIPVTKDIVLNGCETDLESLLVNRRVNEHNYLRILEGIFMRFVPFVEYLMNLWGSCCDMKNSVEDRNRVVANAATWRVSVLDVIFCGD